MAKKVKTSSKTISGSGATYNGSNSTGIKDVIKVYGNRNTVNARKGNDQITVYKGKKHNIYGGAGKDTITIGKKASSGIKIYGDDNKNKISGNDSIIINGGSKNSIYAGKGNDTITIIGGKNNYIYGGKGFDTFIIGKNSTGTAIIKDYGTTKGNMDLIKVAGRTITGAKLSKESVILTAGKSSLTVEHAKGRTILLQDSRGNYAMSDTAITLGNNFKGTLNTSTLLPTVKMVSGTERADSISVSGGFGTTFFTRGGADIINVARGESHIIDSGTDSDTITISDGKEIQVYANDGNDVIRINGGNKHNINGGRGYDKIYINAGSDHQIVKTGDSYGNIAGSDYIEINKGAGDGTKVENYGGITGDETIIINGGNKHWIQLGNEGKQNVTVNNGNEHSVRLTGNAVNQATVTVNGGNNNHIICEGTYNNAIYDINVLKGEGHNVDLSYTYTTGANITVAAKNVSLELDNCYKSNNVTVQWSNNIGTLSIESNHDLTTNGIANTLTISGANSTDFNFIESGYAELSLVSKTNSGCSIQIEGGFDYIFSEVTFDNGTFYSYADIVKG